MKYVQRAKNAVLVSLGAIYQNEYRLIEDHCHELNIVGAFYHFYRSMFGNQFSPYHIDMEYSRMGTRKVAKVINIPDGKQVCPYCRKTHSRRIRSDFIIHKAGTDDNLLVVEFKGEWSAGCMEWDEVKLCELTKPIRSRPKGESYVCGYKLGISILLRESGVGLHYFAKGKTIGDRFDISKDCLIGKYDCHTSAQGELTHENVKSARK